MYQAARIFESVSIAAWARTEDSDTTREMTTMDALRIAADIALAASRAGLPVEEFLDAEHERIAAIARGMRRPQPTAIVCRACGGESMVEVCDSPTGSGPETHTEKCRACDKLGREQCACGYPGVAIVDDVARCGRRRCPVGSVDAAAVRRLP